MERRIIAQLFDSIDSLSAMGNGGGNSAAQGSEDSVGGADDAAPGAEAQAENTVRIAEAVLESIGSSTKVGKSVEVNTDAESAQDPDKANLVVLIVATNK
jgi:hypothetical protein